METNKIQTSKPDGLSHRERRALQHKIHAGELFMKALHERLNASLKPWLAHEIEQEQLEQNRKDAENKTIPEVVTPVLSRAAPSVLEPVSTAPIVTNLTNEMQGTADRYRLPLFRVLLANTSAAVSTTQAHCQTPVIRHPHCKTIDKITSNLNRSSRLESLFPTSFGWIDSYRYFNDRRRKKKIVPYLPCLNTTLGFIPNPYYVSIENLYDTVFYLGDMNTNKRVRQSFRGYPFPNAQWNESDVLVNWREIVSRPYCLNDYRQDMQIICELGSIDVNFYEWRRAYCNPYADSILSRPAILDDGELIIYERSKRIKKGPYNLRLSVCEDIEQQYNSCYFTQNGDDCMLSVSSVVDQ